MMRTTLILVFLLAAACQGVPTEPPSAAKTGGTQGRANSPYDSLVPAKFESELDRLVLKGLQAHNLRPAALSSDGVFVRRVFLDVIGTLPSGHEARTFLLDTAPRKRAKLIDQLLAREEFADYQAMKWSDILRVKAEFPINLWPNGAQAYYRWIHTSLKENLPYDRFARELLTASGSNFRVPQVNFYRAMQNREPRGIARMVALTFMGERAEKWPADRLEGMAGFFTQLGYKSTAEWKEEIVFCDPEKSLNAATNRAIYPDGTKARLSSGCDPRLDFTDWLVKPGNPWFASCLVNRVWYWLVGRGIVEEPDDIRPDNPPSNPELLAWLEREFAKGGYDLKKLYRTILNSTTYQLSSVPTTRDSAALAHFAYHPIRRLEAEVLIDAINELTGSTEKYSSAVPEPFTYIPESHRSISLPDASIGSPFLEMFGRPARDTGLLSERNYGVTGAQRLHLLNSSHIQRKLAGCQAVQYQSRRKPREAVAGLYLGTLSRFPTEAESAAFEEYCSARGGRRREAVEDLAWALVNCAEFLYQH